MGKATRLKAELEDVSSLLEILTVLKDVSANRYFVYAANKISYKKLEDIFFEFFDLFTHTESTCPLVKNDNKRADILVLTSEQGFMSLLNSKVSAIALEEYSKHPDSRVICIGQKGADKCRSMGMKIEKTFALPTDGDRGEIIDEIQDYLIERVKSGEAGKLLIAHVWAKGLGFLKPELDPLLPLSDVTAKYRPGRTAPEKQDFIMETNFDDIVMSLAERWIHARLFELINDLQIVESAAKATQLDSALESLDVEKKKVILNFRKATREELNAAMRGVVTSTNMTKAKARAKAKKEAA